MIETIAAVAFFVLLGLAYVKGYDLVKAKSPEHLPHFYLIMATVRILLVLTLVGLYALFSESRDDTIRFALTCLGLYVVMMVVTLTLRH